MSHLVLTDANFAQEVLESDLPVLVDFWAPWCGPCRMVGPIVEKLAEEFAGRVIIGKLNVDDNPQISQKYGIMSIPTMKVFKGGQVVDEMIGAYPEDSLRQKLEQIASN